jgi:chaperonin GroEL
LVNTISVLDELKLEGDEATGVKIVKRALEEPLRWIAINSGRDAAVVADFVKKSEKGIGYDAMADEFGNMVAKGIVDPTKVVRAEIENGASIACMLLTAEALVADIPEKERAGMPAYPSPEY